MEREKIAIARIMIERIDISKPSNGRNERKAELMPREAARPKPQEAQPGTKRLRATPNVPIKPVFDFALAAFLVLKIINETKIPIRSEIISRETNEERAIVSCMFIERLKKNFNAEIGPASLKKGKKVL